MRPTDTEACVTGTPNEDEGEKREANDYHAIANRLDEAIAALVGNMHEPHPATGDSVTLTKDGALTACIRLMRLRNWVRGLGESAEQYFREGS